ncbi:hypothetical protein BDV96DRAFT_187118 [Lophiotrema nucula]|uniref:C2H2-type domain-containing protein n=1 Tax=Lophiotrema nucula TaxID=690887 RepID=A0A6A5YYE9_9PLEO|nr:hypothetical protein BDV96DRAFT_187118 [Lophiotrema nucula]
MTILDDVPASPNSARNGCDIEEPRASNEPQRKASTVHYTRTGRISKAKKDRKVHNCPCGRSYTRAEHLRRHQKNHAQDALVCDFPECGKTFNRIDLLQRHQERHNEIEKDSQTAPQNVGSVAPHTRSIPSLSVESVDTGYVSGPSDWAFDALVCDFPECAKTFNQVDLLRRHQERHNESSNEAKHSSESALTLPHGRGLTHVSVPVPVDGFGTAIPWNDPFDTKSASDVSPSIASGDSGYASAISGAGDYANMFANPPYGAAAKRTRTSATSATSTMPYIRTSSEKETAANGGYVYPIIYVPLSTGIDPIAHKMAHHIHDSELMAQSNPQELAYHFPEQAFGSFPPMFPSEVLPSIKKDESIKNEWHIKKERDMKKEDSIKKWSAIKQEWDIKNEQDHKKEGGTTNEEEGSAEIDAALCFTEVRSRIDVPHDPIQEQQRPASAGDSLPVSPQRALKHHFTPEDDQLLLELKEQKNFTWEQIAEFFPSKHLDTLQVRYSTELRSTTSCLRFRAEGIAIGEGLARERKEFQLPTPSRSIEAGPLPLKHDGLNPPGIDRIPRSLESTTEFAAPDRDPPLLGAEITTQSPEPIVSATVVSGQRQTANCTGVTSVSGDDSVSDVEISDIESSTDESDLSSTSTSVNIHSLVISARSRMIDTLMRQVHISLSDLSIVPISAANDGNSNTGSSQSTTSSATGNSSAKSRGKRKIGDGDEGSPNDENEDWNSKRRKNNDKSVRSDGSQPVRFACPFFKHNPRAHKRTACRYPGFTGIHRMKEHLYRDHIHISCHRCNIIFKSDDELREHQRGDPCVVSDCEPPDGISTTQLARLKSKKRFGKEGTEEEKWRAIYQYLFPDEDANLVSPYCDDWVGEEDDGHRLTDFELFCRREFTRMVRRELDTLLEQRAQPLEDDLRAELVSVVQRCRDSLYPEFERQSRTPGSASQPSGSGEIQSAILPLQPQETSQHPSTSLPPLDSGSDTDLFPNSLSPHSLSESHAPRSFMPLGGFVYDPGDVGQQFGSVDYELPQHNPVPFSGSSDTGDLFMSTVLQKDAGADLNDYLNGTHAFDAPWDSTSFS